MKSFDLNEIKFGGAVIGIAMSKYNASCGDEDSQPFIDMLYREYKEAGSPQDIRKWIEMRLDGEFRYIDVPPVWVEEEPIWPYHNGKPMVFIMQKKIQEKYKDLVGWGYVLYVFGAREEVREYNGWKLVTKIVTQNYVL